MNMRASGASEFRNFLHLLILKLLFPSIFSGVPACYKSWGERAFARAGPSLWNSLPSHLRNMSSKESFKIELKTYLFHEF